MIKAVIFDFGGVVAEEGFREGLKAIAGKYGRDPDEFFSTCRELVFETGYVTGGSGEHDYWQAVRKRTGIQGSEEELRSEILSRFIVRDEMLRLAEKVRSAGYITAILSDQTNWLDEINRRKPFYRLFDHVFNSYKMHKSKRDPSVFDDVCKVLGVNPEEALFIDDSAGNIQKAAQKGLKTIHFRDVESFEREIGLTAVDIYRT